MVLRESWMVSIETESSIALSVVRQRTDAVFSVVMQCALAAMTPAFHLNAFQAALRFVCDNRPNKYATVVAESECNGSVIPLKTWHMEFHSFCDDAQPLCRIGDEHDKLPKGMPSLECKLNQDEIRNTNEIFRDVKYVGEIYWNVY